MALNVKKCKQCGKIFQVVNSELCPECTQKLDEWFLQIRDYLDEHPHARVSEIAAELEIKEKIILDFIKQGRILVKEAVFSCVHCGKPIGSGDLCDDCRSNISGRINEAVEAKKKLMEKFETGVSVNRTGGMHVKK